MVKKITLAFLLLTSFSAQSVDGFGAAKKKMYKKVFNNSGETFYCGCDWSKKKVDLKSCGLGGYFPKKRLKRAKRTEAEHIIPASWMLKVNKKFRLCTIDAKALKKNKRDYCRKHDIGYKKAHNDLANLIPAVGQINADRSNKPYLDKVKVVKEGYGKCTAVSGKRGFVPPDQVKGDIARVAFYMSKTYGVVYSKRQSDLFSKWNALDPVSDNEKAHHKKIIQVQGYGLAL